MPNPHLLRRSDSGAFLREWLSDPLRVASVTPSGRALATMMTREIDAGTGLVIELGPGTGVFTDALIARGVPEAKLVLVEMGANFANLLRYRLPAATVLEMDASRLGKVDLPEPAGAVISGLPILAMPPRTVLQILHGAFAHLRDGGAMYQFTYGPRCPVRRSMLERLGLEARRIGGAVLNVPPASVYRDYAGIVIEPLIALMARLRDPATGCPWDVAQDFASIAPYTVEEAYEVAQAIADDDMVELRDELGDLLLQVVFHARIAEERGLFGFADVVAAIVDKMTRRHPHVFGDARPDADAAAQKLTWEALKAREKPRASALSGVAVALPALMRADKLQRRAARTGFDWPDADGARAKIDEELVEFETAAGPADRAEEAGDLLFAVVNWLRKHEIDPEVALRAANAKFERRFQAMERAAGDEFAQLDLAAKEELWQAAKAGERA